MTKSFLSKWAHVIDRLPKDYLRAETDAMGVAFDSEGDSVSACIEKALNQAQLAIDEYYNGDRQWAERWLLAAYEANQEKK